MWGGPLDAETREALEAVRRFVDGFTSGMKQPDPTPYPTPQQVRSDLARIEQTLHDLTEEREEALRPDAEWQQEVRRIVAERDAANEKTHQWQSSSNHWRNLARAAEAEAARLRDELNELRYLATMLVEACERMGDRGVEESAPKLRAALSPPTDGEAT